MEVTDSDNKQTLLWSIGTTSYGIVIKGWKLKQSTPLSWSLYFKILTVVIN